MNKKQKIDNRVDPHNLLFWFLLPTVRKLSHCWSFCWTSEELQFGCFWQQPSFDQLTVTSARSVQSLLVFIFLKDSRSFCLLFFFPVTWIKPLHQNNHKNSKLSTFCYLIVKRGSTCVRSLNLKPVSSDSRCWTFPAKQTLFSEFDVWEEVTPRLPTNKVVLFKKKKEKEEDLLSFSTNERKKRTAWRVRAHGALTEDFLSLIRTGKWGCSSHTKQNWTTEGGKTKSWRVTSEEL